MILPVSGIHWQERTLLYKKITCIVIAWGMGWSLAGSNRPTSEGPSGSYASIGDIVRENVSPFQLDIGFPIGVISVKLSLPRIDVLDVLL